jgi:hypothetical protein
MNSAPPTLVTWMWSASALQRAWGRVRTAVIARRRGGRAATASCVILSFPCESGGLTSDQEAGRRIDPASRLAGGRTPAGSGLSQAGATHTQGSPVRLARPPALYEDGTTVGLQDAARTSGRGGDAARIAFPAHPRSALRGGALGRTSVWLPPS